MNVYIYIYDGKQPTSKHNTKRQYRSKHIDISNMSCQLCTVHTVQHFHGPPLSYGRITKITNPKSQETNETRH